MYSITSSVGYMLAVLLSYVFSSEYPFNVPKTVFSPFYFGYNGQSTILNLDVTFKNIQTSVTHLTITRNTYENYYDSPGPTVTPAYVNVDEKTRESEFIILETLKYSQIWFDIALYNRTGLCYKSQIIEGRKINKLYTGDFYWDTTQSKRTYYYNNYTKYVSDVHYFPPNVCKMEVDLSKACEDQQVSTDNNLKCNKENSQYVCTFVPDNVMKDNSIVLYQISEENTTIEPLLEFKAISALNLYFYFELFDNNTFLKLEATSLQYKTIKSFKISMTAKDIGNFNRDVTIQNYTETNNYFKFSCEEYKDRNFKTYVGVINTTVNKIIKTVALRTRIKLKMEDSGTMLCCIVYEVRESVAPAHEITLTRSVINKVLFIYHSDESTTTNQPETDEQTKLPSSGNNWWLFLIPIICVIVLIPIIFIIIKQCWHKLCANSRPESGTEEVNDNANTNQVLYAKLDFGRNGGGDQTANKTEESEYATIVGVVHQF